MRLGLTVFMDPTTRTFLLNTLITFHTKQETRTGKLHSLSNEKCEHDPSLSTGTLKSHRGGPRCRTVARSVLRHPLFLVFAPARFVGPICSYVFWCIYHEAMQRL